MACSPFRFEVLIRDGQRPVEMPLQVRHQPGDGVAASPFEHVNTQPIGRGVEA